MKNQITRHTLWWVILICAAPMIASYFAYYVIKPAPRNNYGILLDPRQYPLPATLEGLFAHQGKWLMLYINGSHCDPQCEERLFKMRQWRLMQGKERHRLQRLWLVTDDGKINPAILAHYDGTTIIRVNPDILRAWLPTKASTQQKDHFYLIDPLGNLMMRFPKEANPHKVNRDLTRLLRASAIG